MCLSIACHSSDPIVVETATALFEQFGEFSSADAPSLLSYLDKYTNDQKMKYEFLYEYYRMRENHVLTSKYMFALSHIDGLLLEERISNLALAAVNARCIDPQTQDYDQEYVNGILLRLEWAKLQGSVKGVVKKNGGPEAADAIKFLDQALLSPAELSAKFAGYPYATQLLEEATKNM